MVRVDADGLHNLMLSGFPDLHPRRMDVYPFGCGFFHGTKRMSGFIYVMSNKAVPMAVKIGMTTKHPSQRANELFTTGVPFPFKVEFAMWVDDPQEAEKATHEHFSAYRVSDSREFFEVCVEDVAKFVTENYVFWNNTVVNVDMAFDEADLWMFCEKAGLEHPASVTKMLLCVSDQALNEASAVYRDQCEQRRIRYGIKRELPHE